MARLPRIVIPNQPLHIMHRGNNRQNIFEDEEDMFRLKEYLDLSLSNSNCYLHAYVIMTNHVHLLITPEDQTQLKILMQSVANRYVRYFNSKNKRTGTIWEGRYKSCLIDSDNYLLVLYKYIELNPVKAGMIKNIANYKWSSYQHNALGKPDKLITEYQIYKDLGINMQQRHTQYQRLFDMIATIEQDRQITEATQRGEVYAITLILKVIWTMIARVTKLTTLVVYRNIEH